MAIQMSKNYEKSKKNNRARKILQGYRQHGKRFIPPALQLSFPLHEASYVLNTLPEIIWMGLINDSLGLKEGSQLYVRLATTAKKNHKSDIHKNFALCSAYSFLTKEECSKTINDIGAEAHALLKKSLEPLIVLHEGFPLSFIGKNEKTDDKEILIKRLKQCVERHFDRFGRTTLQTLAGITYIGVVTGIAHYCFVIPDLNDVITNRNSEVTEKAAGFIRNGAMSAVMRQGELYGHTWAKSFWNHGMKIDSCVFKGIDE